MKRLKPRFCYYCTKPLEGKYYKAACPFHIQELWCELKGIKEKKTILDEYITKKDNPYGRSSEHGDNLQDAMQGEVPTNVHDETGRGYEIGVSVTGTQAMEGEATDGGD
jgi:hypothetical protein